MIKVCIIGGGIAGLSAAHVLCRYSIFDIHIYEKEADVGGQARSAKSEMCHTEYSWRIYGETYDNLAQIIRELGVMGNFIPLNACIISNDLADSGDLTVVNMLRQIIKHGNLNTINKLLEIVTICKDRAINEYDNVNAYEHFEKNDIIHTILGPFLGMEGNKVSLSSFMKNVYSITAKSNYGFPHTSITKYPTQESLFIPWRQYLQRRGVTIHLNSSLTEIIPSTDLHQINGVVINDNTEKYDKYIFACSLNSILNSIKNTRLINQPTFVNMSRLIKDLQLYFTINVYFSEKLGSYNNDIGKKKYCSEIILVDTPWKLIIQKKRTWDRYLNECNKDIKDVWNIGFLDYNKGSNNKILRECSKEEAIQEGLNQLKHDKYITGLLQSKGKSFDDIFIGVESWYQFKNNAQNKLIIENPKFSLNVGSDQYRPTTQPYDIPSNMFLCGYYVKNTMGGVSMEASCETGLEAAKTLIGPSVPIRYHSNNSITTFTYPLILLDQILYNFNLPNITEFVSPITLLVIYTLLLIYLMLYKI